MADVEVEGHFEGRCNSQNQSNRLLYNDMWLPSPSMLRLDFVHVLELRSLERKKKETYLRPHTLCQKTKGSIYKMLNATIRPEIAAVKRSTCCVSGHHSNIYLELEHPTEAHVLNE